MLNNLSPDAINNFSNLLGQMDHILERQLEITEQVLKLEKQIATNKMASMKQYFDSYSKALDGVTRKQSDLDDGFLMLSEQLDKATREYKASTGGNTAGNTGNSNSSNSNGGNGTGGKPKKSSQDKSVTASFNDTDLQEVSLGPSEADIKRYQEQREHLLQFIEKRTLEVNDHLYETEKERDNRLLKDKEAREEEILAFRVKQMSKLAEKQQEIENNTAELNARRYRTDKEKYDDVIEFKLNRLSAVTKAELDAQTMMDSLNAEIKYATESPEDAADLRYREVNATEDLKSMQELEQQMSDYRAMLEYKARKKNNDLLTKEELIEIEKKVAKEKNLKLASLKDFDKERHKKEQEDRANKNTKAIEDAMSTPLSKENNLLSKLKTLNEIGRDEETGDRSLRDGLLVAAVAVSNLAKQLEVKIDQIGNHKGLIDTRLQGSSNQKSSGSYWDQLTKDMMSVGAVTPFFKQEKFAANIDTLVKSGISFDLKQRAFLMTIQEKIANTFNVADGTLLRLIRIQQEDSTAGRLGMESALNSFLNEMYETSEYLTDVAASVRSSLEEMESLASGKEATEIEFQVQKWMGSLYSVGMSQAAVQSIAQALGQIGAGQIEGITNGGTGNLLIMAANDAGLSIADLLIDGIDSSDTNKLMKATVEYLAEIAKTSEDNRVVQQQLADVFGVKASDLRAATNLVSGGSIGSVFGRTDSYDQMLTQLYSMAGSMASRTSIAEMMTNLWENGQYTLAGSMASNPVSYFIYKMAKVVDDAAGGIDLPFLNVMGFGVDLNTTVSDLMRVAAVGTGILGSIGHMISGLASSFSGRSMLQKMGIESGANLTVTPRGTGSGGDGGAGGGGSSSTSGSGYIGNSSGSDIKDSTIQESEDSKKQQMIEAKEEEEANQVDVLNETVIKIYELLDDVAHGSGSLRVKVEGYGLTGTSGRANGAMAGLDGIANGGGSATSGGSAGSSLSGAGNAGGNGGGASLAGTGAGGSMDLGGWTLI